MGKTKPVVVTTKIVQTIPGNHESWVVQADVYVNGNFSYCKRTESVGLRIAKLYENLFRTQVELEASIGYRDIV